MLCILKIKHGPLNEEFNIVGWIIASDLDDARRKDDGAGERGLATQLYRMFAPTASKTWLQSDDPDHKYLMLTYESGSMF